MDKETKDKEMKRLCTIYIVQDWVYSILEPARGRRTLIADRATCWNAEMDGAYTAVEGR